MRSILAYITLTVFVFSCNGNKESRLIGTWTASAVVQDKRNLKVDLDKIKFQFENNGTYKFTSTLDYAEAGTFNVEGEKLMTTDTTNTKQTKAVLIQKLDADTLKLRMKNENGWMDLTMLKK